MQVIGGKSQKTVEEYFLDLRTFFRYLKVKNNLVPPETDFEKIDIKDVDLKLLENVDMLEIYEYLNYLVQERKNQARSRSRKISSLRTFFKYLTTKTSELEFNPMQEIETPKHGKSMPKFLSLDQSKKLLETAKQYGGEYKERDVCILTLFLNCGMRVSELVNIDLKDFGENNTLKLRGKGNKERIIYINEMCQSAIDNYRLKRPNDGLKDRNALFVSRQNKRISVKTVQFLVKKYLKLAGLENYGFSVHKLRHTAATLMYQHSGVDIRILKEILGHENLGTTEIYTHVSNNQIKEALDSNPLN